MKYETIFNHLQATLVQAMEAGLPSHQIFASAATRARELMEELGSKEGMHGTRGLRPNIPFRIDVRGLLKDRFLRVNLYHRNGDAWEIRALAFLDAQNEAPPICTTRGFLCGGEYKVSRPPEVYSQLPVDVAHVCAVVNRQADEWERTLLLAA